jgi:putative ABC transport system permease protein
MHRGYAAMTRPDRPTARIASARRIVAEAALVLGSTGGLVALRYQTAGSRSGDIYASAAPILAAIPVALVMLRLYPLLVRPLLALATRSSGVTAFLGLARAARVAATAVLPAFAMVLALSLVSFAGMVRGAVVRGEAAEAWQAVGADAVISVPGAISAAERHSIDALPGVRRTVPVVLAAAQAGRGTALTVVLADPAQYTALRADTPLGSVPASFARWRGPARGGSAAVPVLASGTLAAQFGGQATTVTLQGSERLQIEVVGSAPAMAQVQDIAGPNVRGYLIVPRSAVGAFPPPASALLVGGPALDGGALTAAVAKWHVSGSLAVVRSQLLASLEHAPLQHGAYTELAVGGDAAAVGCMLVLLLTLLLSVQSRQLTLARAAAMGMTPAQGRWLSLIETLPQILAVIVGGLVSALVLVPLIGPELGLSVFTGSTASVPVRIEPAWLAGTAIGLLVLALVTLTSQTVLASRQAPRSLRIGG